MPHVLPSDAEKFQLDKDELTQSLVYQLPIRMKQYDSITVPQSTPFTWRLSVKSSP